MESEISSDPLNLFGFVQANHFIREEVDSIYVDRNSRFVVSLIVGYAEDEGVMSPEGAIHAALELTRDEGCATTHWCVYDRLTGIAKIIEQQMIEDYVEEDDWDAEDDDDEDDEE